MAHIKKIEFNRVGQYEGCCCDKCGQYIRNIWIVTYTDGLVMNFGIDCFSKLNAEKLNAYGMKEMKKALKHIEDHKAGFEAEKLLTEETDEDWKFIQENDQESYWYGRSYEEYHKWILEEWWQERFRQDQKQIDRFRKVNFNR